MRKDAEEILAKADAPDDIERRAVPAPSAPHGLQALAEQEGAVLLVVGSTHRGAIGLIEPGGVAQRVLHGCPCAVAIAPAGYANADEALRRIAVGYIDTDDGAAALRAATAIAAATGCVLQAIGVAEPVQQSVGKGAGVAYPEYVQAVREKTQQMVEEAAAALPEDVAAEGVLLEGHVAQALETYAASNDHLLIVGSRGYGPLRQVLAGSVSGELLRHAAVPLVVVPRGGVDQLSAVTTSADTHVEP
jgi:nucleotide-binding universal stress UspA family protein